MKMDNLRKDIADLIDNLEDTSVNNKDLHVAKFVLIENILKAKGFGGISLVSRLIRRLNRIKSKNIIFLVKSII